MKGIKRTAVCILVALWSGRTFAAEQNQCRTLKDERDSLASQAMTAEIALGRKYREQICPGLAQQVDQENTNEKRSKTIDYEALINCRNMAEVKLERNNKVLYRNRLGFTFYTQKGASLARKADLKSAEAGNQDCQQ